MCWIPALTSRLQAHSRGFTPTWGAKGGVGRQTVTPSQGLNSPFGQSSLGLANPGVLGPTPTSSQTQST